MAVRYSGGQAIPDPTDPFEQHQERFTPYDWSNFSFPQLTNEQVSTYTGIAGTGLEVMNSLLSSIAAGKRAKQLANYNAEVAQVNAQAQAQAANNEALQYLRQAKIAQQDELLAADAQAWREARERDQNERVLANTRAIVASSGILMTGTPLAVYEETVRQQGLQLAAERYTVGLQQRATRERGTQAEYAATMARYGASERLRVGRQAATLAREQGEGDYALAGLTRAAGAATKGLATYQSQQATLSLSKKRLEAAGSSDSLLSSGRQTFG